MSQRVSDPTTTTTSDVARHWFESLGRGAIDDALACLSEDVLWINYTVVPGFNDDMPWIGTYHGRQAVLDSFKTFTSVCDVQSEKVIRMAVQGEDAACVVHEQSVVRATGIPFDIEFIQWLTVRNGQIVRWKSYTDPSSIVAAIRGVRAAR